MTIRFDIKEQAELAELVARMEAGEEVLLMRDGEAVATINAAKPAERPRGQRVPGLWAKYGPLEDPDLFLRPDPELEAMMDARIFPVRE
jgi:antitoxin (DNA-binding transcriptional repressor) of toxin-antitoxin stability system